MTRALRGLRAPVIALLAIELLDELVFGAREAAWPAVREELDLSYAQIGLLLSVPAYASVVVEPVFGVLGDSRWRRTVVVVGGIGMALALALVAAAPGFVVLLVAFALAVPFHGRVRVALTGDADGSRAPASRAEHDALERRRRCRRVRRAVPARALHRGRRGWRELFATFAVVALALTAVAAATHSRVQAHAGRPSLRADVRRVFAVRSSCGGSCCSSSQTCSSTCSSATSRSTSSTRRVRRRR